MDLYSNTNYMGSHEFGMPVPAFKSLAGVYHMAGCVETAPEAFLLSGSTSCFGVLKAEGEKHGLSIATFNPLSCFSDTDDLTNVKSSAGLSIWREDDPCT